MSTNKKIISMASDHSGFELKEYIKEHLNRDKYDIIDFGTNDNQSVDYPDFAKLVTKSIINKISSMGILICGSGIGMSIAANRYRLIRAALCYNLRAVELSRQHNNCNILVLGAKMIEQEDSIIFVNSFLSTEFEGGRHLKRINKIEENL